MLAIVESPPFTEGVNWTFFKATILEGKGKTSGFSSPFRIGDGIWSFPTLDDSETPFLAYPGAANDADLTSGANNALAALLEMTKLFARLLG